MGDTAFVYHVGALVRSTRPLIVADGSGPLTLESRVHLTATGERVLAGEVDRVRHAGIDRWLGGVHLTGFGPVWRFTGQQLMFV
jgi:hypothetical protein